MRAKFFALLLIVIALINVTAAETLNSRQAFKQGYDRWQTNQYYPAIDSFKLAISDSSYPLLDYAYFYTAQCYEKSNNFELALQVYKTVSDYFPNSLMAPKALFASAKIEIKRKNHTAANSNLRVFISKFPNDEAVPEARYLLGLNLEAQGQFVEAARTYRNLDLLHRNSNFAEKAIDRLDQLAKNSPLAIYEAPAASIYNLGIKYFQANNYVKANGYFNRLAKFYRKSSFYDEALLMLGRVELRRGRFSQASQYFKKCLNLDKDSKPVAMLYLGITFAYQDNLSASTAMLEKVVSMYPNSYAADQALFYAGRYYTKMKDLASAQKVYLKIVTDYPGSENFTQALWQVGNIYYQNSSFEAAYDTFSQINTLPANKASDQLYFWLAKSAEKVAKKDQAISVYKTTVKLYDHSYYAYRAREELKKYNIIISPASLPKESNENYFLSDDFKTSDDHKAKFNELMALGLGDEAAEEATFLADQAPPEKQDTVRLAQYHAYVMKGKFTKPINYAENKIAAASSAGNLADLDSRLWRLSYPRGYWSLVEKYSEQYNIDPYLVYAVIREESRFQSQALSRASAQGLMQVMPGTARLLANALGLRYSRWKSYQPRVNIQMGTYYLAGLIKRFDGNVPLALAGYNGGPVRVQKWVKAQDNNFDLDSFVDNIPILETRNYVKKVMKSYYGYQRTYGNKG